MSAGADVSTAPARPRLTPSAWWYVAAGAIALAGIVAGVWMMAERVGDVLEAVEDLDRTDVPGTLTVTIEDPGGYSIYHEFPGAGDSGSRSLVPEPDLSITNPNGDDIRLRPYTSLVTYAWGTIEGRGLYTFRADEPGTYELTADGDEGTSIAVGRGMGDIGQEALVGLFSGVAGGLLVGGLSIAVASILAVWVGVARSRKRRGSLPPPPPHVGWAPPPTWPPYNPTLWPPAPSPPRRPRSGTPQDAPPQPVPQPVAPARPPTAGSHYAQQPPGRQPAQAVGLPTAGPQDAPPRPVPPSRPTVGPQDAPPRPRPQPAPPARPPTTGPQAAQQPPGAQPAQPGEVPTAGPGDAPLQPSPQPVPPPAQPAMAGSKGPQPRAAPSVRPTAPPQDAPRQSITQSAPPEVSPTGEPTRGAPRPPVVGPTGRSGAAGSSVRSGPAEPHVPGDAPTLPGSPPAGSLAACPPVSGRPDAPMPWSRPTETVGRPGDPPSLRSPADWSRSDVEIPWDPDSL